MQGAVNSGLIVQIAVAVVEFFDSCVQAGPLEPLGTKLMGPSSF